MFAVVAIAGTQELVTEGQKLKVPLHDAKSGDTIRLENVLLVADGTSISVGSPLVAGASVEAKVLGHGQGDKIRVVKAHRRKRYRRVKGHRQQYTEIEVTSVSAA
ncbi:MAG: large subunit ribosomal protein L21 [Candidatus Peregrinibacteria bacterium Greene0416_19]|nr:MAG: large subunit ribosomal protein L21 [Candidatus Peregrinibacteria bacterium Greene0416_19]